MRALLVVVAIAATARADVWQRALDGTTNIEAYESAMVRGDESALAANSRSISPREIPGHLDAAIESYREAAKADPKAGEPFFRIGSLLYAFYYDCQYSRVLHTGPPPATCTGSDEDKARQIVEAWETFERLAPLDPRVREVLFNRALMRTKLVTFDPTNRALLEGAMHDYRALIDRGDGMSHYDPNIVLGNLAETYMMLGRLEDAIDTYQDAIRAGGGISTIYGLAVAFDREDRGELALALIRDRGFDQYQDFANSFRSGAVFFVPAGEEFYYFALIEEAFGNYETSVRYWRDFIRSGAHPKYHARAKEHIDGLKTKRNQGRGLELWR